MRTKGWVVKHEKSGLIRDDLYLQKGSNLLHIWTWGPRKTARVFLTKFEASVEVEGFPWRRVFRLTGRSKKEIISKREAEQLLAAGAKLMDSLAPRVRAMKVPR